MEKNTMSKPVRISGAGSFSGSKGLVYKYEIEFANKDFGVYYLTPENENYKEGSVEEIPFRVGLVSTYKVVKESGKDPKIVHVGEAAKKEGARKDYQTWKDINILYQVCLKEAAEYFRQEGHPDLEDPDVIQKIGQVVEYAEIMTGKSLEKINRIVKNLEK